MESLLSPRVRCSAGSAPVQRRILPALLYLGKRPAAPAPRTGMHRIAAGVGNARLAPRCQWPTVMVFRGLMECPMPWSDGRTGGDVDGIMSRVSLYLYRYASWLPGRASACPGLVAFLPFPLDAKNSSVIIIIYLLETRR